MTYITTKIPLNTTSKDRYPTSTTDSIAALATREMQENFSNEKWYSAKHAAIFLGVPSRALEIMVEAGKLRLGKEVKNIGSNDNPVYRFHLQNCAESLNKVGK